YSSELFERGTIERLAKQWAMLLDAMVADPEQRVDEAPLLTQWEREELLVEWNRTATAYPADRVLQQLFEEQVEKRRESPALVYEGEKLSYRELNSRANHLAHFLREQGVGAETRVGLCVERTIDMVVGMLGIVKSGGVYVPLDPSYPPE